MADASIRTTRTRKGSPRWELMFRIRGRQTSRMFTEQAAAEHWLHLFHGLGPERALALLDAAEDTPAQAPTVAEIVERHITGLTGITDGTRASYRREAGRDITPHLGALPVTALDETTAKAWVNLLQREGGSRGQGLSGKTITNRHALLSAAISEAVRDGHLTRNPFHGLRLPVHQAAGEAVFLTEQQLAELLDVIDPRYRDFVIVVVGTGMRWQEATALQCHDVWRDEHAVRVMIRRAWKDVDAGPMQLGAPKSPRARRTIPIDVPSPVVDALERATAGRPPAAWVFTSPRGAVMRNGTFHQRVWGPAMRRLLLPADDGGRGWQVRPSVHDLRHTAASFMIAAGADILAVSRVLGHEKTSTTLDRYGHLLPGAGASAVAGLGARVSAALSLEVREQGSQR